MTIHKDVSTPPTGQMLQKWQFLSNYASRSLQSRGTAAQEGLREQQTDMDYTSYNYKKKYTHIKEILENKRK